MRILYLSQYFPPEVGATQTRAYEMARGLVNAGHEVTMLTEVPNHPTGIIRPKYRNKAWVRRNLDGIDVIHAWVKASPIKNTRSRMMFYLTYMGMAFFTGMLLARGKYDVVYCTSPPLFAGGAGLALSYLRRTPFVFEVRDLWPKSAVELGELNSQRAIRWATMLEEACYRRARQIVVVSEGIKQELTDRGYPETKIAVIPNGANTELYTPQPPDLALREQLGIPIDNFVVAYTGLHGLAHGLETALQAADLLRDENVTFLFVGNGPRKEALKAYSSELNLPNVIFHDAVPEHELPAYINLADMGLDTRRKVSISKGTLPVKMFTYMACACPVLLAIEGEAINLLHKAEAGVVVPPEDANSLAAAIRQLQNAPEKRAELGRNGRVFVEANFSRQRFAQQLGDLLSQVVT